MAAQAAPSLTTDQAGVHGEPSLDAPESPDRRHQRRTPPQTDIASATILCPLARHARGNASCWLCWQTSLLSWLPSRVPVLDKLHARLGRLLQSLAARQTGAFACLFIYFRSPPFETSNLSCSHLSPSAMALYGPTRNVDMSKLVPPHLWLPRLTTSRQEAELAVNIKKATSPDETAPKSTSLAQIIRATS